MFNTKTSGNYRWLTGPFPLDSGPWRDPEKKTRAEMGGYFGPPPNFQGNGAHFYHSVKENKAPFHFFFSPSLRQSKVMMMRSQQSELQYNIAAYLGFYFLTIPSTIVAWRNGLLLWCLFTVKSHTLFAPTSTDVRCTAWTEHHQDCLSYSARKISKVVKLF